MRQSLPVQDMQFDHRGAWRYLSLGTKFVRSRSTQSSAGLDIIDGDDVSDFVSQDHIRSDAVFRAVVCPRLQAESRLDIAESNSRQSLEAHHGSEGLMKHHSILL